jgi:hypothetical protein
MVAIQALGIYDPFTHTVWDDPYPIYRRLRNEYPVYHNEERGCWVVSRFDDIQAISRDVETYSCAAGVDLDLPATYLGPGDFLATDPPVHTRLRRILHEHFTPRAIERLENTVRARVRLLLGGVRDGDTVDLSAVLAMPLPMYTILTLMGFAEDDGPQVRDWLHATTLRIPGSPDRPPECDAAHDALADYIGRFLDERRRGPRDDLITVMAQAVADGRMSLDETRGMSLLVLVAGWVTTACLISNAVFLLAQHPEQQQALADDPAAIPAGIEEILRLESPVQYLMRTTTRDVGLHGVTIPEGGKVLLLYAAGNRDERRWEDPDRLDVRRPPQRHLAFGDGIHHCLGAPLSRLSGRVALEEVLARWPRFQLTGPIARLDSVVLRGIHRLPVRLVPA